MKVAEKPARRTKTVDKKAQGSTNAETVRFDATLDTIEGWTVLRLPKKASDRLPSRGQVAVHGTLNDHPFQAVLEPGPLGPLDEG